jgi:hypothetical protein
LQKSIAVVLQKNALTAFARLAERRAGARRRLTKRANDHATAIK